MYRFLARRPELACSLALLSVLALAAAPAAAQQCDESVDWNLSTSCTVSPNACEVGEMATFWLVGTTEVPLGGDCEPPQRCCIISLNIPDDAWYNGEKWVNGQWMEDADCVYAANPLHYTYQSGDVGLYRRQACTTSSCSTCSQWVTIEVIDP